MTASEVTELVRAGRSDALSSVDVVTTATRAVMSGTYASLSFPVAGPGSFLRARRAWINGVPAGVGPCPNENLGVLDLVVFGTAHSRSRPGYGGGHLFRELVEGKRVQVEVETDTGRMMEIAVGLEDMPHARLFGSRHAFKNYSAFVNAGVNPVKTIFHSRDFAPELREATFSGCGSINPLKNDPMIESIGVGTRILMNGAPGYVIGTGTRSSRERPNLSGFANMHQMNSEYLGGFGTSAGPECICSWAVPVPVISRRIFAEIARPNREIPMPVNDVCSRSAIGLADYGCVWDDVDLRVEFEPDGCQECRLCAAEAACPMRALDRSSGAVKRSEELCFHCGACVSVCPRGVFRSRLGAIPLQGSDGGTVSIPVVLRQSDRLRAERLTQELKSMIIQGDFRICEPVGRI